MGQYFRLIAPRRREVLSWHGKLGEILFDGSASELVTLFARPVLPLNDTEEEPENKAVAVQGAVVPQKRRRESGSEPSHSQEYQQEKAARCRLLEVPAEIKYIIFDFLNIQDVFLLGITCKQLWAMTKPIFQRHFAAYLGTWAGTPIVCAGDETDRGRDAAYPHGLLSKDDLDELHEGLDVEELEHDLEEYAEKPVNLFSIAHARYDFTEGYISFPQDLLGIALDCKRPYPEDRLRVANPRPSSFYPPDQEWVLRNLTTQEFVRPTAIALNEKYISGPYIRVLGYGEVILSRICWSTSDSTSMCWEGIHQGVWAGHALDIVPSTYLDRGGPWKDISDDVAMDIAEIWKSEYGDDWRNILSKN
ncbi:hypothetical protein LOZ36_001773 [Ophidiomyces ophidiicola]|nr:hypothetical protein LOZ36_001773 [Ophidiomyces ophidiicola]